MNLPSPSEAAAAVALVVIPGIASFASKTTIPPTFGQRQILYEPNCEAYAGWPSGTSPSCAELAQHALKLFEFTPYELLQEASDRLLGKQPRPPEALSRRLASEGLRRLLDTLDPVREQPPVGSSRFTYGEVEAAALSLLSQAGLPLPQVGAGNDHRNLRVSVVKPFQPPVKPRRRLSPEDATVAPLEARPLPLYLALPTWAGNVGGRAALNGLGLRSRWVDLGPTFGRMHFYDSHPDKNSRSLLVSAPPLLVIHGMFTNGLSLGLLALAFADLGAGSGSERRVILPDLLDSDFGSSVGSHNDPSGSLSEAGFSNGVAAHTASLAALLNKLNIGSVDICGHSFGGFLAQELAAELPPWRTRRLLLLCPGGGNRYRAGRSLRTLWGPDPGELFQHAIPASSTMRGLVGTLFRHMIRTPNQSALLLDFFDAFRYFLRFRPLPHVPALIFWGDADSVLEPRPASVQLAQLSHPSSRGVWVQGGSHALNFDSVRNVYELGTEFLGVDVDAVALIDSKHDSAWFEQRGWFVRSFVSKMKRRELFAMDPSAGRDEKNKLPLQGEPKPRSRL